MAVTDQTLLVLQEQLLNWEERTQYLVFSIYTEQYGLELAEIQEVINYLKPAKLPESPGWIAGVINCRGEIIPVVDLRNLLGLKFVNYDKNTAIVIVKATDQPYGLIIDRVDDLLGLTATATEAPPEQKTVLKFRYLKAVAHLEQQTIFILDPQKLHAEIQADRLVE